MSDIQKIIDKANAGDVKPWVSPELGVVPLTVGENVQPLTVGPHLPYATGDTRPNIFNLCEECLDQIYGEPCFVKLCEKCRAVVEKPQPSSPLDDSKELPERPVCTARFAKHDHGKPMHQLIPPDALDAAVRALTFGAEKYAPGDWQGRPPLDYYDKIQRHLTAWRQGTVMDESGLSHLAHVIADAVILYSLVHQKETTHENP